MTLEADPQEVVFPLPAPLRPGRPRKDAVASGTLVRSTSIRVSVTPRELRAFRRLAREAGMSVSQWARRAIYVGEGLNPKSLGIAAAAPVSDTPRKRQPRGSTVKR
jgi:hypothetical protein